MQPHNLAVLKLVGTGAGSCSGKLRLRVRLRLAHQRFGLKTIGTAVFSISAGRRVSVSVKLNARGPSADADAPRAAEREHADREESSPAPLAGEHRERAPERRQPAEAQGERARALAGAARAAASQAPALSSRASMGAIPINIAELVGGTPLVGLPRCSRAAGGRERRRAVREARGVQPRRQRQGPHRRGDDRGGRGRRPDRAGTHDDRRGDQRQHRHRARVRVRRQGLRAGADAAAGDEPRAREPAAPVRRARRHHRVDGRHGRGGRGGAGDGARAPTCSSPTSSPTRPTPRRTGARPGRRSRGRSTAASTCWSPASAPAARSPASASTCASTSTRSCGSWRSSRAGRPCSRAGAPGPHRIQGIGAGFVPPVLNRELIDEVIPVCDDDAIRTAWTLRQTRGPARRDLLRRGAVGGARGRRAPGVAGQADRRDDARLRRALRLAGLLRPLDPDASATRSGRYAVAMAGFGTLAAGRQRGPSRRARGARPRPGRPRRVARGDPRHVAGHPRAARLPRRARAARWPACRCCRG